MTLTKTRPSITVINVNINSTEPFRALSIYFGCPIVYNGILFCSAIQLLTWLKTKSPRLRTKILSMYDPKSIAFYGTELGMAHLHARDKAKGLKPIRLRADWEEKHLDYARKVTLLKMEQNPVIKRILLESDGKLVETDQNAYWCHPVKKNQYGLLLQKMRAELKGK